ncbi:hypothetical protein [Streptomyces sp. CB01201]|uniref:hypothetical protein n=1 Tax=Streptomyces sp. CB01201 TaxID=2020324 RepID=UPI001F40C488|nr:hypothetical protein [Streptomyces sp. CB01201]
MAQESLAAADGPDAPPDDPASRKARHAAQAAARSGGDDYDAEADAAATRDRMLAMAAELRSFPPVMFGVLDDEDEEGEEEGDFGALPEDAKLAAGALVYGMHLLVDELFQDVQTLTRERTNVAECERPFWLLEELPERYALQYNAHFARRFPVTAIAMTTRFTNGSFGQLSCVAEELALGLLLREAEVSLDVVGLLDAGASDALESFAANVFEDMDHEGLYDDSTDGIDESPRRGGPRYRTHVDRLVVQAVQRRPLRAPVRRGRVRGNVPLTGHGATGCGCPAKCCRPRWTGGFRMSSAPTPPSHWITACKAGAEAPALPAQLASVDV